MNQLTGYSTVARSKTATCDSSYKDVDDETARDAAQRFGVTSIRAGATEPVFIISHTVRCRRSETSSPAAESLSELAFTLPLFLAPRREREPAVPRRGQSVGFRLGSATDDGVPQGQDTRQSCDASFSKQLAAAQQYLQALRECDSPPAELREAWEAFYRACDPLVCRTVAACSIHRADLDDCAQEAWAEIAGKLIRFEYDPNRGSFESWLRIVVHRAACRHARRDLRQTAGRNDEDLSALTCPRILGPATNSQREELRASVRQTLDAFRTSVSSTAFRILVMTAVHSQTSTEIGKLLGLTPGNVRVSRHRTAQKFRHFIAAQPALADVFGIFLLPNGSTETETSGKQRCDGLTEF